MRPERVVTQGGFLTGDGKDAVGAFLGFASESAGRVDVGGILALGETTVLFPVVVSWVTNAAFRRSTDTFSERPLMSMV